ncbi:MAG TPA: glycosyltransferase family 39 protein, partial [Gemmatimonadaceae bacterium]|nr:glycosyltransferase family 39 protein [Gemmatimonadaceae bacterium]
MRHRAAALGRDPPALVALVLAAGTVLRLVLAATLGMGVDESYATVVARAPSLSYFDHPPLSFWIPALLARVAGTERAVVLRLPFILLFAGTTWLTYRIGARLFGRAAGAWAAALLNLAPVFAVSTGGWVLPDGPLDCFMLAAVWCVSRALLTPSRAPTAWWMGAGLAAGLAALSKYHAVFLPAGVALFLATSREHRRVLRTPGPWVAAAIAAACALP